MSKRAYKTYTKAFKVEAVRLVEESGQPVTQTARELGLRVNQIYKWRKELETKQDSAFRNTRGKTQSDKDAKIRRLEKALAASQEENAFLKKRRCSLPGTIQAIRRDSPTPSATLRSNDVPSAGRIAQWL